MPIAPNGGATHVFVNASGLSDLATLTVEILDEQFRPLPEYSGANSLPLEKNGLRLPVRWKGGATLTNLSGPIRVRVNWGGPRPDGAKLHAVYVQ
jgi:hypothetical protein